MKIKAIAVTQVISILLLVIYIGYYLYLRSTKYLIHLIHKYTTGDGNKIVTGDVNIMIFLFSENPETAAREYIEIQNITIFFTTQ